MKLILLAILLTTASASVVASDGSTASRIGQSRYYGRLDFGDYPPPQLVNPWPRAIRTVSMGRPPVYMYVPPEHARNWSKYCRNYNACGERVFFVQNYWYEHEYFPHYQAYSVDSKR